MISTVVPTLAKAYPSLVAFRHCGTSINYGDLYEQASRLAGALQGRGISPGDRVGLFGYPSLSLCVAEHAVVAAGAIPVGLCPSMVEAQIDHILETTQTHLVMVDRGSIRDDRLRSSADTMDTRDDGDPLLEWITRDRNDVALIVTSSGTTGLPKCIAHTFTGISNWLGFSGRTIGCRRDCHVLLPNLANGSGQLAFWAAAFSGGCLILVDDYPADVVDFVTMIEKERITAIGLAGGMVRALLALPHLDTFDLTSLRSVTISGSPVSGETLRRFSERFPRILVNATYGLVEAGLAVSALPVNYVMGSRRFGLLDSVGSPQAVRMFGQEPFEVRIERPSGEAVRDGEPGEILIRGPGMMRGYWVNTSVHDSLKDGWLHTGDIGRLDGDGYLYLLDRKTDLIKLPTGRTVYGLEVEKAVASHPSIQDVAAVSAFFGGEAEEVALAVSLRPGHDVTLDALRQFCAGRLSDEKLPTRLRVMDALPYTQAAKVDKRLLRDMFRG